ncbi:hypothetical protein F7725_005828 [Dissostichus mawsoni]|uniref:DUF4757 domain-containing protein n=1 Tax=Dissostichus mawsoni TaxID=36200 RepID=A0A7J5YTK7_DISMA|nr:hypothetical protein F7725_005828 [Dissostichus mawsoni]
MASESSIVTVAAEPQASLSRASTLLKCAGLRERQGADGRQEGHMTTPKTSVTDVTKPLSTLSSSSATSLTCKVEKSSVEERVEERKTEMNERKKPFWLDDDDLPPIMTVSMSDILNEEEVGHLPPLSQSRNERMHEQYNNSQEDDDPWRNDLARWKSRRRCASQDLIKKEEERKRMEKRMKEEGIDSNKRKSIKTYKEIVEEKERRELELCEAYRNAGTPEEAAMVLQRYALRFTISDATLDSLKLPRSTSNSKQEHNQVDKENTLTPTIDETSEPPHKPEQPVIKEQRHTEPEDMETKITQQETSVSVSSSSGSPGSPLSPVTISENVPPQSLKLNEPRAKPTESPTTPQKPPAAEETKPHTNHARPQIVQVQPHTTQPTYTLPSPQPVSPRPVPLLAAKPYCQPRSTQSGHKPVKMDGLVRVNGEVTEDLPCSTPPTSALHSPSKVKDVPSEQKEEEVPSKQTEKDAPSEKISSNHEKVEHTPSPQREKPTTCLGSAISSLIGGRNCTTTTIIVTELTHTEPHHPDIHSNGQVNGTSGLSSPVEENKSQSATSSHSMQDYSPTVTGAIPEEQKKLKQEWEKAQLEVQEEERKHNEEERKILEETVTPLNPTGLLNQQPVQTGTTSSATENNAAEGGNVPPQQNGQRREGADDQHESKLHFFQDSPCDSEPSKKQELWKTASLDRKPQLNQSQFVKRSESHDAVTSKPQPPPHHLSPPHPPGAAMIIDTLGLFFHVQCFKVLSYSTIFKSRKCFANFKSELFLCISLPQCAVCEGQLGDATVGTDVRIRNGLLSCHECYIASREVSPPHYDDLDVTWNPSLSLSFCMKEEHYISYCEYCSDGVDVLAIVYSHRLTASESVPYVMNARVWVCAGVIHTHTDHLVSAHSDSVFITQRKRALSSFIATNVSLLLFCLFFFINVEHHNKMDSRGPALYAPACSSVDLSRSTEEDSLVDGPLIPADALHSTIRRNFQSVPTPCHAGLLSVLHVAYVVLSMCVAVLCVLEFGQKDVCNNILGNVRGDSVIVFGKVCLWVLVLLFTGCVQHHHNQARSRGYLHFYRQTQGLKHLPLTVHSAGNVLLLVVLAVRLSQTVQTYMLLSVLGLELLIAVPCLLYYTGDAVQQGASCTRREPRRAFTQLQCDQPTHGDRLQRGLQSGGGGGEAGRPDRVPETTQHLTEQEAAKPHGSALTTVPPPPPPPREPDHFNTPLSKHKGERDLWITQEEASCKWRTVKEAKWEEEEEERSHGSQIRGEGFLSLCYDPR